MGSSFQEDSDARVLVVGGDSLLGAAIQRHCRKHRMSVAVTSRRPGVGQGDGTIFLDLSDPDFAPFAAADYRLAFICAAVTDMRACQEAPARTRQVNVAGTIEIMRRLAARGTHLVFLSSSQVFDGETPAPDEDAATSPKNEYGAQKVAVELAIAQHDLPAAILRVTKVLADHPVGVFKGWSESLGRGVSVKAATNMALSPVMVGDVAQAAERLGTARHRGIWHLGACDDIGYFEAARLMAERRHLPASLITGQALAEAEVPAIYRHRHVTLSCGKIARSLDMPLRRSRDVLDTLFADFPQPAAPR